MTCVLEKWSGRASGRCRRMAPAPPVQLAMLMINNNRFPIHLCTCPPSPDRIFAHTWKHSTGSLLSDHFALPRPDAARRAYFSELDDDLELSLARHAPSLQSIPKSQQLNPDRAGQYKRVRPPNHNRPFQPLLRPPSGPFRPLVLPSTLPTTRRRVGDPRAHDGGVAALKRAPTVPTASSSAHPSLSRRPAAIPSTASCAQVPARAFQIPQRLREQVTAATRRPCANRSDELPRFKIGIRPTGSCVRPE